MAPSRVAPSLRNFASPTERRLQEKPCASGAASDYLSPLLCGCSSVVEHLLAKEDVASSSLVTRSLSAGRGCLPESLADESKPERRGQSPRPNARSSLRGRHVVVAQDHICAN